MKKILSVILFCLTAISILGGTILAQEEPQPTGHYNYNNTDIGINFSDGCLTGMGKGCFDYEKIIGIDKVQNQNITTTSIAQDILLSATYMVGTVLTVVIIYCGLGYIFAAKGGKDPKEYKDGLVKAAIGALLVRGAYAIVRLIQYIAKG